MPDSTKMKILVIDSEGTARRSLRTCLEKEGHEVIEAATGHEGVHAAIRSRPGAVLLELTLSDIDGLKVLKQLREWTQAPVLMVSARNCDDDKIAALDSGANDYITKPFSTGELLARLRVAHRLAPPPPEEPTRFCCGGLHVDLVAHTVLMKGQRVELTDTEYSLLALFVKHSGKVLTYGCLLRKIWGTTDPAKMAHLRLYVEHLWEKLRADPVRPELFFANTGLGYRLVVKEKM
jgi:two-component system KDP operon response regulator KdpE